MHTRMNLMSTTPPSNKHQAVWGDLLRLYADSFCHDGYADLRVEMRILRRGQKEVIIHCGKQYRHVLDFEATVDTPEQTTKSLPDWSRPAAQDPRHSDTKSRAEHLKHQ